MGPPDRVGAVVHRDATRGLGAKRQHLARRRTSASAELDLVVPCVVDQLTTLATDGAGDVRDVVRPDAAASADDGDPGSHPLRHQFS